MLGSCLIDGSPLQIARRECCLRWPRSFDNAGKKLGSNNTFCCLPFRDKYCISSGCQDLQILA